MIERLVLKPNRQIFDGNVQLCPNEEIQLRMIGKSRFSLELIKHFQAHFSNWNTGLDFEAFARANLYLLTVHVDAVSADAAMLHFRVKHFEFLKALLGKNVGKQVGIQPFGYAFIDFAGTRHGWSPFEVQPHVHALMMIHPDTRKRLDEIIDTVEIFKHRRLVDAQGEDLEYVASYCCKGIVGAGGFHRGRDGYWEIFPHLAAKSSTSRWSR